MSIFAIGDVHGHSMMLTELANYMTFTEDDLIVFTGDYVDKGPDVRGTLEQLIEFNKGYQCVFLRGNHDQSFIDACNDSF